MNCTKIEWTDATWNPTTGCTKVSAGCKHCYAEREWPRMTRLVPAYAGREFSDVRCHEDRLVQPLRWKKPRRIFVNSMSDLFHPAVPDDFIQLVFHAMSASHWHTFQVLTKRPERMRDFVKGFYTPGEDAYLPLPNVWLGVSVEDQKTADVRIPPLLDTPAAVRWISAEPLLGPVRLDEHGLHGGPGQLDWVVVGGESGPEARPMHPDWARVLREQCDAAGVPFLFKQWGEWLPCIRVTESGHDGRDIAHGGEGDHAYMKRVGKKRAGRLLDGVTHDGYPRGGL